MFRPDAFDQLARGQAFLLGAQHDGRAVRVVGTHVVGLMTAHALEAYPDIGLDVLDQVADMDRPVGIRQGGSDEDATFGHGQARKVRAGREQGAARG